MVGEYKSGLKYQSPRTENSNGATDDRGLRLLRKLKTKVAKVAKAAERTIKRCILLSSTLAASNPTRPNNTKSKPNTGKYAIERINEVNMSKATLKMRIALALPDLPP